MKLLRTIGQGPVHDCKTNNFARTVRHAGIRPGRYDERALPRRYQGQGPRRCEVPRAEPKTIGTGFERGNGRVEVLVVAKAELKEHQLPKPWVLGARCRMMHGRRPPACIRAYLRLVHLRGRGWRHRPKNMKARDEHKHHRPAARSDKGSKNCLCWHACGND
jgi:hypothetical protein